MLGLERSSIVWVSLASTASVVLSVVTIPVRSSVVDVVPGTVPGVPVTSTTSTTSTPVVVVVSPVSGWRPPVSSPSTARSSSLLGSVPGRSVWSRTGVAAVLSLPGVSGTGGVGLPGPVLGTGGSRQETVRQFIVVISPEKCPPDGRSHRTGELTEGPGKVEGAVARNTRTDPCDLLLHPGLVLDTAGHVGPAPVSLALGDIVPTSGADHGTGVSNVGLGAVAGEARAGHQAGDCGTSWDH